MLYIKFIVFPTDEVHNNGYFCCDWEHEMFLLIAFFILFVFLSPFPFFLNRIQRGSPPMCKIYLKKQYKVKKKKNLQTATKPTKQMSEL
jgi:hypothetical protein